MKRIKFIFLAGMLLATAPLMASENDGVMGSFGPDKLWKTSATQTNEQSVIIATSVNNVALGWVMVDSAGSSDSKITLFDGRTSTGISKANNLGVWPIGTSSMKQVLFSVPISSGLGYSIEGTNLPILRILWDYTRPPRQ